MTLLRGDSFLTNVGLSNHCLVVCYFLIGSCTHLVRLEGSILLEIPGAAEGNTLPVLCCLHSAFSCHQAGLGQYPERRRTVTAPE